MMAFLGTTKAARRATTGHISLSRDIIRDWRRWSTAERVGAGCLLMLILAEIPILAGFHLL